MPRHSRFARLAMVLILLHAMACTSMSPAGWLALSRLDPLRTDPRDMAAAVAVSRQVRFTTGDVVMHFRYRPGTANEPAVSEHMVLSVTAAAMHGAGRRGASKEAARNGAAGSDWPGLRDLAGAAPTAIDQVPLRPDEHLYAAHIAVADQARLRRAQQRVLALREQDDGGAGELTLEVVSGCYLGAALQALPVRTLLRTDGGDGFVQLTRSADLFEELDAAAARDLRGRFTPCAG